MKRNQLFIILAIAVLLIAGVVIVLQWQGSTDQIASVASPTVTTETRNEASLPTETAQVQDDESIQPRATDTQQTNLAPTPRAGLTATDPSVVKLASGEIQLVEFFAFW